ncbi:MAG: Ppx/GppA phosphatase family protein [Syntrophales bacterium]|nr:Ppx/GppA phosphatase family protein [Syntrophales bacterium]MDD5641875.1 Ppx/GppA phosphatase family protein [Syntrophales bacterium]
MLRFAAVDLGSLTVRLAVAELTGPGRFQILGHYRQVTGLGEGLARDNTLAPEPMDRTLKALGRFVQIMQAEGVKVARVVATQAVRQARNQEVFVRQVQEVMGLPVHILAPEEEARLSLQGVLSALAPEIIAAPELVVFDVGGGSSEWALIRQGQEPRFASLPLGVLTLSQTIPLGDPPRPAALAAMKQEILSRLEEFHQQYLQPHLQGTPLLVGTAGAVTTLAALALVMSPYDASRVNNLVLTKGQVAALTDLLCRLAEADRARLPGMEPAKAGVMVAGALIILGILEVCRQDSLVVIDAGLLEGVLGEMAAESGEGG